MSTVDLFKTRLKSENYSTAFIQVLITAIEQSKQQTFGELNDFIKMQIDAVIEACKKDKTILQHRNPLCLESVSSYFELIIKKTHKKYGNGIGAFKAGLLEVSKYFLECIGNGTRNIVANSKDIFKPAIRIMTYSYSRSVIMAIKEANDKYGDLTVLVPETCPYKQGYKACQELVQYGVNCRTILDNQVNFYMSKVDMVILGAQAVLENGAIISRTGTSIVALSAFSKNKPLYVFAESYKFYRRFILDESSIPQEYLKLRRGETDEQEMDCTTVDFTEPKYIQLLFTDLGIFTTAEVSDGLVKMFYN